MIIRKEERGKQKYLCRNHKIQKGVTNVFFVFVISFCWFCNVGLMNYNTLQFRLNITNDCDGKELGWGWIVEPGEYEDCCLLGEELIAVKKENGHYGVIDKTGEFVFENEYEEIGSYCEGIARVRNGEKVFFIDKTGKRISKRNFQDAYSFQEGKAPVMFNNNLWGMINTNGDVLIEGKYDEIKNFQEGFAAVCIKDKWGFINGAGKTIISCQYDEVKNFQEGFAAIRIKDKWGFINRAGKTIISCQYDEVKNFQEGFAAVCIEDKWGFANDVGEVIIELKYDAVGNFSEGKAAVKRNNYFNGYMDAWAYVDKTDSIVIDYYAYTAIEGRIEHVGEFQNGMAFVSDGFYSIIDDKGKYIFDGQKSPFFISVLEYSEKYDAIPAYIYADDAMMIKKYGLVGVDGGKRIEPIFDYIHGIWDDYMLISREIDGVWKYGIILLEDSVKDIGGEF